jgi:NTE family protein
MIGQIEFWLVISMNIFNLHLFDKKGVGLVLGGGGVRGFFHVGVINALRENNIQVNQIAGTSIGAIVGALYAADPKIKFEEILGDLNFFKISTLIASTYGKLKTTELENFLQSYLKVQTFEELKIPSSFCATDLNNKREVIFNKGPLFPAMAASFAIPGIFPPVEYEGNFLVDGGVVNSIPISHIEHEDKIVISDITGPIKNIDLKTNNLDVLNTALSVAQQNNSLSHLQQSEHKHTKVIHLELKDDATFMLDFRRQNYQRLIDLGYAAFLESLPLIID